MLSWIIVGAVVYRQLGEAAFAVLMMTRATLGLLNYTAFGMGPAVVHFTGRALAKKPIDPIVAEPVEQTPPSATVMEYEPIHSWRPPPVRRGGESPSTVLFHAHVAVAIATIIGVMIAVAYSQFFGAIHDLPVGVARTEGFVFWLGIGMLARLAGDSVAGASHALNRLPQDQFAMMAADLLWAWLIVFLSIWQSSRLELFDVGWTYALSGIAAYFLRNRLAHVAARSNTLSSGRERIPLDFYFLGRLVAYGGLVTLGSAADFLYAPIDYFILNRFVNPLAPAIYAPAVQIDAAILILTTAIATVALPAAARMFATGDMTGVWRQYVRGSLLAGGVAILAAVPAWLLSPWIFQIWLGDDLPATRVILPLILIHTVLGSAAGVGRSTLLAIGWAGRYALVVLAGGLVNVAASLAFVYAGLGITGVVLGTVLSVALRCLIVMPILVRWATAERDEAEGVERLRS